MELRDLTPEFRAQSGESHKKWLAAQPMGRWSKKAKMVYGGITQPTPEQIARRAKLEREYWQVMQDALAVKARLGAVLLALGPWGEGLYRWTHERFEDYCAQVLQIPGRTVYRLMQDCAAYKAVSRRTQFGAFNEDLPQSANFAKTLHLLPILTDNHAIRALGNVSPTYREKVLDALEASPESPTDKTIKALAAKIVPPKTPKSAGKSTGVYADHMRTLLAAAEVLSGLAESKTWSDPHDRELGATMASLRSVKGKLRSCST
jgi:hypothetical protein